MTAETADSCSNPEVELAEQYTRTTDCNLFLTGRAGTGKTTFLKNIQKKCSKRLIVTAPTGVAAINAGGVTLHSFFQIPFGPFVPGSEAHSHSSRNRFSREKRNIIKSLDLLIIDEISMVRADVLDAVEGVLRRYRRNNAPFGGVQLLMIGDLQQLTPVVRESDRPILEQFYRTPYFFSSKGLEHSQLVTIELKHIYRQSDPHFIDLLNKVRDDRLDSAALKKLNNRFDPDFLSQNTGGYITLCTHNHQADSINADRLQALTGEEYTFAADVEGDFPEHSYPTAPFLQLKLDSQVMFLRNDSAPEKRFYNGKIGRITHINKDEISVLCQGAENSIAVKPVTWENIEYSLDEDSGELREEKVGIFVQYPLKTAWAITIHKSQGLTFEQAIIDAQAAFAHGQVYVALSRCRTLEGIVLNSPLAATTVRTDRAVLRFIEKTRSGSQVRRQLEGQQIRYQQRLLLECFNFQTFRNLLQKYSGMVSKNREKIQLAGVVDLPEVCTKIWSDICTVGENFQRQLQGLFRENELPADTELIRERITKASNYFEEKLRTLFFVPFDQLHLDTDNKEVGKQLERLLQQVKEEGAVKLAVVISCRDGFSPQEYLRAISSAEIQSNKDNTKKKKQPFYSEDDVAYPDFFEILRKWRSQKADEENISAYQVLHQKTLVQIAVHLPDSLTQLKSIKGIGEILAKRYGKELVAMAARYRRENAISTVALPLRLDLPMPDKQAASSKEDTRKATLSLFQQGLAISEIAQARSLVTNTIEGHLAYFVGKGQLAIDHLVTGERRVLIEQAIEQAGDASMRAVKDILGEEGSYGEIKLVLAHLNRGKTKDDGLGN